MLYTKGLKSAGFKKSKISEKDVNMLSKMISIDTSFSKNSDKIFQLIRSHLLKSLRSSKSMEYRELEKKGIKSALFIHNGSSDKNFTLIDVHYDVVPALGWRNAFIPFRDNEFLVGRGSNDNKGLILPALKAFEYVVLNEKRLNLILAITGDEEFKTRGAASVAEFLKQNQINLKNLIILEPTNTEFFGEKIKIGFRGRMKVKLRIQGSSFHTARLALGSNPLASLSSILFLSFNSYHTGFPGDSSEMVPTSFAITNINTYNDSDNSTPSEIILQLDVRHNIAQTKEKIKNYLENMDHNANLSVEEISLAFNPILTRDLKLANLLATIFSKYTGIYPELATSGGASNAIEYFKFFDPSYVEFGTTIYNIHAKNERVSVLELQSLSEILIDFIETLSK